MSFYEIAGELQQGWSRGDQRGSTGLIQRVNRGKARLGSREPCEPPDFLDAVSLSSSYRSNVSRALNLFS